jgi:hypothetical protein
VCCEQTGEGEDKPFGRLALSRALACTHAHMHLVEAIAAQVRHVGMVGEWVLGLACHSMAIAFSGMSAAHARTIWGNYDPSV